ncbi:MAG: NAD(+) diphosphatase [Clostridia bacterium]|nr:NAD(+) diphosphatase [Clostridia bacterium]
MIQDIWPHVFHNEFRRDASAQDDSPVIVYQSGTFMLDVDESSHAFRFPTVSDLTEAARASLMYLFELDGVMYFAPASQDGDLQGILRVPDAFSAWRLTDLRRAAYEPKEYMFLLFTAYHLLEWVHANRYCGCCGGPLQQDETERAMYCPACKRKVYPRINPAVIIGVINGNRLLITRYRNGVGMNALVAGFTEIGETFEETVAREVMEETGLRVKHIRYYKSQPWGIAADILTGYYCEVDGDDTIHMDPSELKYAEWVERNEIELQPYPYSLTNEMMQMFRDGHVHAVSEE